MNVSLDVSGTMYMLGNIETVQNSNEIRGKACLMSPCEYSYRQATLSGGRMGQQR